MFRLNISKEIIVELTKVESISDSRPIDSAKSLEGNIPKSGSHQSSSLTQLRRFYDLALQNLENLTSTTAVTSPLPLCALCLRRLRPFTQLQNSRLAEASTKASPSKGEAQTCISAKGDASNNVIRIPRNFIPRYFETDEDVERSGAVRCLVCHFYNNINSQHDELVSLDGYKKYSLESSATELALSNIRVVCHDCCIAENIWLCMVCGTAGCGRYTSQHAKNHYTNTRHNFAIELVSGRIWDYSADDFVHYEAKESCSSKQSSRFDHDDNSSLTNCGDNSVLNGDKSVRSFGFDKSFKAVRNLQVDPTIADKLDVLSSEYEQALQLQLLDQQLFYEKLLARETVRSIESRFQSKKASEVKTDGGNIGDDLCSSDQSLGYLDYIKLSSCLI